MTTGLLNQILTDMVESGELKLGWYGNIKEFKLEQFRIIESSGHSICDLIYSEFPDVNDYRTTVHIPKSTIDRYKRDNIINDMIG